MPLVKAARLADLRRHGLAEVQYGQQRYVLCEYGREVHALEGTCPHAGAPLAQGVLHGRQLVCPWHAWEFDCVTGASDFRPGLSLQKYATRIEGDYVYLELP